MPRPIKKAIFPVGGYGTRFLPVTKVIPKEMLPIINKPLIHYAVQEAIDAGIEEIIFITFRNKQTIEDYFDQAFELEKILEKQPQKDSLLRSVKPILPPGDMIYIRQQEARGLGHAIWCARHLIEPGESFAVLLADDIIFGENCLSELIQATETFQGPILAVEPVEPSEVNKYGMIEVESKPQDGILKLKSVVEKPKIGQAPSHWGIVGRYVLPHDIFKFLDPKNHPSSQEIQLTDAIQKLIEYSNGYSVHFSGQRFDCGTPRGMLAATLMYAKHHPDLKDLL